MTEATQLSALKNPAPREQNMPDLKIDMFSLRGFELAQRIGRAFATSDAVPAIFRSHTAKKGNGGDVTWVENTSALGNCMVAIETAQAVGMSITAVMQNANVIEGRLTWSGKFIIAAINASRRFTPLRFQMLNKGNMKAKYREKQGWNKEKKGFDFLDREVEIENVECRAWALPYGTAFPQNVNTLQQALDAGLPVIQGAAVSVALAVEEGWYSKPGSKWQTGMRELMLQYRAGSFFGNIHAPDVVMGMGRTTEEAQDVIDLEPQPDGGYAVNVDALRAGSGATHAHTESAKQKDNVTDVVDTSTTPTLEAQWAKYDEVLAEYGKKEAENFMPKEPRPSQLAAGDTMTYAQVADALAKAPNLDVLDVAADLISEVADKAQQAELTTMYNQRKEQLAKPTERRARTATAQQVNLE